MKKIGVLILLGAAVCAHNEFVSPKTHAPGVLVKNDPVQVMINSKVDPIQKGKFILEPLARYTIDARILHTKRYWAGDMAELAPYDVAVGWGVMSDQKILDRLTISQGNRFYFYEYQNPPPLPQEEMSSHSANMHLIPCSFGVRETIAWLRIGELVRMEGFLVEATIPNDSEMRPWRSSLSRTDTGNGACEIMWVESIVKLE